MFTSCQLEKIQKGLLNCRDYLICDDAATEVMETNLEVCLGSSAPTFKAVSSCYSWYAAASGGTALATSSQTFTPPMTNTELNTPGTYTYYLEYDNEFYTTSFSGSFYDTYNSHPTSPTTARKAITVTVLGAGTCDCTPGDGVDNCTTIMCSENCTFTTTGATFNAPFSAGDFKTGWALTSGAGTSVGSQADIDALPASQVFGPYDTGTPDHFFTVTCTGGVPDLGVGTYNITPFASKIAAAATTQTFSSGTLSKMINSTSMVSSNIAVSGLPDDATVSQICVTLTHTYSGIVSINTGAPEGAGYVQLVNRPGFPADRPFGTSADFSGTYCFEAGAGAMPEPTSGTIATGTYAPHDSDFSAFIPPSPNGNWALSIDGPIGGTSGTLTNWTITFDIPEVTFPEVDRSCYATFGEPIEFEISMTVPVELVEFKGALVKNEVLLNWATESELNSSHFVLQRSTDAIFFKKLATIESAGHSNSLQKYAYLDTDPAVGVNYYRLLMVDVDGTVEASEVVAIELTAANDYRIAPNPLQDQQLTVEFTGRKQEPLLLEIYTLSGQRLWAETQTVQIGSNRFRVDLPALDQGIYLFHLKTGDASWTERLVKL